MYGALFVQYPYCIKQRITDCFSRAPCIAMEIEVRLPHNPATNRRFSTDTTVLLAADRVGNAVSDDLDLPDEFKCPITCEVMQDPVIALDGHTYERSAIEAWLAVNMSSPLTGAPMPAGELRPNHMVRSMLRQLQGTPSSKAPQGRVWRYMLGVMHPSHRYHYIVGPLAGAFFALLLVRLATPPKVEPTF